MRVHPSLSHLLVCPLLCALLCTLLFGCLDTVGELARLDTHSPDAQTTDAQTTDAQTTDAQTTDAQTTDAQSPDMRAADMRAPDMRAPRVQLCGCGDVQVQTVLEVDDDIAVQGRLSAGQGLTAAGTLYSASDTLGTNAPISLGGLRHAGGVQHGADLAVAGDAHIDGDVRVQGALVVGGALYVPEGAEIVSLNDDRPRVRFGPLPFEWPCACEPDRALADSIEADAPDDRPALGLNRDALANLQDERDLVLTAGRYVFDALGGPGRLSVSIEGAVEWVIRGDLRVDGGLDITLADGASLRLLIGGTLIVSGPTVMGDSSRPDALTVYVLGGPAISISETFAFAGQLRAHGVDLSTSVDLDWRGSVVVERVSAAAGLRLRR